MFISRRRREPDRFLPIKLACLLVGGLLGVLGMRLENGWLVNLAIGVVGVGFLLQFWSPRDGTAPPEG